MSSNLLVYMIIKRVRAGFVLSMEAKNIYVAVVIAKIGKNYLYYLYSKAIDNIGGYYG